MGGIYTFESEQRTALEAFPAGKDVAGILWVVVTHLMSPLAPTDHPELQPTGLTGGEQKKKVLLGFRPDGQKVLFTRWTRGRNPVDSVNVHLLCRAIGVPSGHQTFKRQIIKATRYLNIQSLPP